MTDEKVKQLAKIVLANDARVMHLHLTIRNVLETFLPLIDPKEVPIALLHCLEEVDAIAAHNKVMRAKAREYFDLPPMPTEEG